VDGRLYLFSQLVRGAGNASAAFVKNVRIDHCGTHVIVPQEFLHRPDVIAILQEMSGKRMSKSVRAGERKYRVLLYIAKTFS
jgi:hypothetical protein